MPICIPLFLIFCIPVLVFIAGAWFMNWTAGHKPINDLISNNELQPLNQRYQSYDVDYVTKVWKVVCGYPNGKQIEDRYLKYDLIFPVVYGTALAGAILLADSLGGSTFNPLIICSPVFVTIIADWIENTIQIKQLKKFDRSAGGLNPLLIAIAGRATQVKLLFFGLSLLMIFCVGFH